MKKVIFLSAIAVFSFLEGSASVDKALTDPVYDNPYGRRGAALQASSLPRPLLKDLRPSFGEKAGKGNLFLLGSGDIPCRKHAWWVVGVPSNSFPQNVGGLFDIGGLFGRRGARVSSLAILDKVSIAPAKGVDKQKLARALFESEPTKVGSKFSKHVDVKVRASKRTTSHTTPYKIKTEERRKRIAAGKYLGGHTHASASFSPSRKTGRPTQPFRKYNNQPKYKPAGRR